MVLKGGAGPGKPKGVVKVQAAKPPAKAPMAKGKPQAQMQKGKPQASMQKGKPQVPPAKKVGTRCPSFPRCVM
jgi:hypothetical protein